MRRMTVKKTEKEKSNKNNQLSSESKTAGKKAMKRTGNSEIIFVTYIFVGIFLLLIGNYIYFLYAESKDVINNSYNKRQNLLAERVVRGKILGNNNEVLAETITDSAGKETRNYPYNNIFTHVVGHSTQGKTGIELSENFNLLTSNDNPLENFKLQLEGEKTIGDNVITTLDVNLQKIAYEALGSYKGAIVAMEPSTGKILAMVSKPDYNPNPSSLNNQWNSLVNDTGGSSYLVNRATQGLYPPGSTFKIVTTLEYIRENGNGKNYAYLCQGKEVVDEVVINCYGHKSHGNIDLKSSFAKSCNSSFAHIGANLKPSKFKELCDSLLFNSVLPTKLVHNKSSFVLNKNSKTEEILHTAIGQGKTAMTPLHGALLVSAIANKGVLMKPYDVDRLENSAGNIVRKNEPSAYGSLISEEESAILTEYMEEVVKSGTATSLNGMGYSVAGKTGSAEFDSTKASHAWFLGFAPAKEPRIAVAIIVEGMGTGSEYAVPIAKKLFQAYLR